MGFHHILDLSVCVLIICDSPGVSTVSQDTFAGCHRPKNSPVHPPKSLDINLDRNVNQGIPKAMGQMPLFVLQAAAGGGLREIEGYCPRPESCSIKPAFFSEKPMSVPQIKEQDVEFSAIRASGPGGQNENKVSTAVQLRFAITGSPLSATAQSRLLNYADTRINKDGVIVIKAQRFRSQEKNKEDALARLNGLIAEATHVQRHRIATKPGRSVKERRLQEKKKMGARKSARGPVSTQDY